MLIEFKVWGSSAWNDQAVPLLERAGLVEREDLAWADPDTDGELMGRYYDYPGQAGLEAADLGALLEKVRQLVLGGEVPEISIRYVATPGK